MRRTAFALVAMVAIAAGAYAQNQPAAGTAANPGGLDTHKLPPSYLHPDQLPDSLALLPPPPAQGSEAFKRDEEARQSASTRRASARFELASKDAVIGFPKLPNDFSCAAGIAIGKARTPRLYALMGKMMIDVGLSTYKAKNHYKRVRPFVVHQAATCYPKDEAMLRGDGSYPSGHSAIGWGYALLLTELVPGRADALLKRGREFGQSRLICDAHWQSDIDAGRVIAAATVARLHADPAFRADLDAARAEVVAAASSPPKGCAAEAAALAG